MFGFNIHYLIIDELMNHLYQYGTGTTLDLFGGLDIFDKFYSGSLRNENVTKVVLIIK